MIMYMAIAAPTPLGSMVQAEKLHNSYVLLSEREMSPSLFYQQGMETP